MALFTHILYITFDGETKVSLLLYNARKLSVCVPSVTQIHRGDPGPCGKSVSANSKTSTFFRNFSKFFFFIVGGKGVGLKKYIEVLGPCGKSVSANSKTLIFYRKFLKFFLTPPPRVGGVKKIKILVLHENDVGRSKNMF